MGRYLMLGWWGRCLLLVYKVRWVCGLCWGCDDGRVWFGGWGGVFLGGWGSGRESGREGEW